jgi:hypothetical protein
MIWTDSDISKYGAEVKVLRGMGVRWCTIVRRYKSIFPSIDEGEIKRLLCLYEAALQSTLLDKGGKLNDK